MRLTEGTEDLLQSDFPDFSTEPRVEEPAGTEEEEADVSQELEDDSGGATDPGSKAPELLGLRIKSTES